MQLTRFLYREAGPGRAPRAAWQSLRCAESHIAGWTTGGLLGSGVAPQRARLSPLCDHLPGWKNEPPDTVRPLLGSCHLVCFPLSLMGTC